MNRIINSGLVLWVLLLCWGSSLKSSSILYAKAITLEQFITAVRENNLDLALAEQELAMAGAIKKEAWSTAFPKFTAEGSYNRNLLDNYMFVEMPDFETGEVSVQKFKFSFKNEYAFNAVMSQTLFSFRVNNALKAASEYGKMTDFIYNATQQGVISTSKKLFYQTLLLKEVLRIQSEAETNARENYEQLKKKYDQGVVSELQLLQAEVRWRNQIPEQTAARRNCELALNQIKYLSGVSIDSSLDITGDLEQFPILPQPIQIAQVLQQRPDYNAVLWEERLRLTGVKAQKADYFPSLNGTFVYLFNAVSDQFQLDNRNENYRVGLTLSIPIWLGGYTGAQAQKARIDLEKNRIRKEQMSETIQADLKNIYVRLQEAHERINAAQNTQKAAEKGFRIAQISADNGLITQFELNETRLYFDQAQLNYYAAIYDYLAAWFDWEYTVGQVKE